MKTVYTKTPRGILPMATKHSEWKNVYNFGKRNILSLIESRDTSLGITQQMREAIRNPGVRQVHYQEENGYEYETYAIYDPKTNSITTNWIGCPRSAWHHIGDTCNMCGLVG
jgi:hypothetical protein